MNRLASQPFRVGTRAHGLLLAAALLALSPACTKNAVRPMAPAVLPQAVEAKAEEATEALVAYSSDRRIAVIADLNGRYGSTDYDGYVRNAVARLIEVRPQLVLCTGDMVAGQKPGLDYAAMWEAFHTAVTRPLREAGIPLAVAPGNHDASAYPGFELEREHYRTTWLAEQPELDWVEASHYPFYYAFVHEDALYVALDATVPGALEREQRAWLASILDASPKAMPKVLFGHLPIVSFAEKKERDVLRDPELERLIDAHGVSLMLSGHHQSFYPAQRGELHLVGTGCLGGGPRRLRGTEIAPARSLLFFALDATGLSSLEAYTGLHFDEPFAMEQLPATLGDDEERLALSPLVQEALSPEPEAKDEVAVAQAAEPAPASSLPLAHSSSLPKPETRTLVRAAFAPMGASETGHPGGRLLDDEP